MKTFGENTEIRIKTEKVPKLIQNKAEIYPKLTLAPETYWYLKGIYRVSGRLPANEVSIEKIPGNYKTGISASVDFG